jgi:acyl carrier protein
VDVIEREIAAIVAEVAELEGDEIVSTGTLADAGIDSLMAVEIAVEVERRYSLRFTEEELKQIESFGSLVSLARSKLAAAAP